ncbi:putative nuclease HARBI1 [Conger conger]|uniref:putative nuclease HARBI1 n=1 Tax=Conger conger TaxID=82655 RepID=UPI002A59C49D|nr:putative nuclease HARBI1 [Conger conger]
MVAADAEGGPTGSCALPVALKVTAALAFLTSGSFQDAVSLGAGVSQSAVSAAIHTVCGSLVRHADEHVAFPSSPRRRLRAQQDFRAACGLPRVLGAVDCTHVQLRAPPTRPLAYVNRKGAHSVNIQVTCDANRLVTHVCARYPGSTRDARILANSALPAAFRGHAAADGCLVGDDAYPLKTWLLTPYAAPATPGQRAFNRALGQARAVIDRTLAALKARFRCLDRSCGTLQYSPQRVSAFFVACCVLHNMAARTGGALDLPEAALEDFRRREAELHAPFAGEEDAEARERRDLEAQRLAP